MQHVPRGAVRINGEPRLLAGWRSAPRWWASRDAGNVGASWSGPAAALCPLGLRHPSVHQRGLRREAAAGVGPDMDGDVPLGGGTARRAGQGCGSRGGRMRKDEATADW